jgi:hypothetical protein
MADLAVGNNGEGRRAKRWVERDVKRLARFWGVLLSV